jgi:hypothetical protein
MSAFGIRWYSESTTWAGSKGLPAPEVQRIDDDILVVGDREFEK